MKATIQQLFEATPAIQLLLGCPKLPIKASYAVGKLAKAVDSELKQYQEKKQKIFDDAGCILSEDKTRYVHTDEAVLLACAKDAQDLTGAEAEIYALPLDLEQFGNAEVPGAAFFGLEFAMKEETK